MRVFSRAKGAGAIAWRDKGIDMRIVRTIVLLAAAAFFLPSPPEDRPGATAQGGDPLATEYFSAAVSTVADMRDFCSRQAAVCDTAHYLAVKLEGKARYSIELLYQWAQESNGTAMQQQAASEAEAGANTLKLEDLIPEWRAPKPARQS
jgi:hypothetical protein